MEDSEIRSRKGKRVVIYIEGESSSYRQPLNEHGESWRIKQLRPRSSKTNNADNFIQTPDFAISPIFLLEYVLDIFAIILTTSV